MDLLLCRGGSSLTKKVGIDIYLNKEVLHKVWTKHIVLFEGLVNEGHYQDKAQGSFV